ncbi:tRNA glutamyl-Q(34) synthetase GluQRS [Psychromarinibacter sp. C21-152]|uniref:tRNA glutamyl-Q(34) synthetase GluQRS n=1 Tax=Psychromarinibacter sediminicola TaxID=3033385 RepID=A0AAE3NRC2_9RHOB|nr:tRNA glutamyl-Q(34) synthetase GluQRS [Psychromarinibacter sediminicola]MDF0599535.1 tRNA glutamyl-Q(34) synthetase GluQRS [Psychromarinibacter sediminicola]
MSYATRFAPSPTGLLHLGHAFSALTAFDRAAAQGGTFLLRIEDIDRDRSRASYEAMIFEDLHWLGLAWPEPVMRQSDRMPAYRAALDRLIAMGLCYPCSCTRGDIRAALSAPQEGAPVQGPDGLVYPGTCRGRPMAGAGPTDAIRLDIRAALDHLGAAPFFDEKGPLHEGRHAIAPEDVIHGIGDVILARKEMGTSYHLSVVVDDAAQAITEVVRGDDLFAATRIHVLLQALLDLPVPAYYHHRLIRDETGKRLAKRDDARAIRSYRAAGLSPSDLRGLTTDS